MSELNVNIYLDKLVSRPTPKPKTAIPLLRKQETTNEPIELTVVDKTTKVNIKRDVVIADYHLQLGFIQNKRRVTDSTIKPPKQKKVMFVEYFPEQVEEMRINENGFDTSVKIPILEPTPLIIEPPFAEETSTEETSTKTPVTKTPVTEETVDEPSVTETPFVEDTVTEPPVTEPPVTEPTLAEETEPVPPSGKVVKKPTKKQALNPQKPAKKVVNRTKKNKLEPDIIAATEIDGIPIQDRIPHSDALDKLVVRAPAYYMSNRKLYIQKISELFREFSENTSAPVSCDNMGSSSSSGTRDLFMHQRIVREYLNVYTPYRGLLLYHGLGSGKTCTSIAIAEGAKTQKRVFVLTPASLKMNFFSELKKCGDPLYKKNQYWEFVSTEGRPEYINMLANSLSISRETVLKHGGAWLQDIRKAEPNFGELTGEQQKTLDNQLNEMIRSKYVDINYNGLNTERLDAIVAKYGNPKLSIKKKNPFDHSVVLVDEAHNLVSRIVNRIKTDKTKTSVSSRLYEYLLSATDVRIVFMTGTPIINYPHEIGVLFNMLRGYVNTWKYKIQSNIQLTKQKILDIFSAERFNTYDYIDYSNDKLTITRNPWGFVNALEPSMHVGTKKTAPPPFRMKGGNKSKKHKAHHQHHHKSTQKLSIAFKSGETVFTDPYLTEKGVVRLPIKEPIVPELSDDLRHIINNDGITDLHSGGAPIVNDKYQGVHLDEQGNISNEDFNKEVIRILEKHNISLTSKVAIEHEKCLPDTLDEFSKHFIDMNTLTLRRTDVIQKRVLGLTSYFRSAQESLLPSFVLSTDNINPNYHPVMIVMSDHQFTQYTKQRSVEIEKEPKRSTKKADDNQKLIKTGSSSYRVFSRLSCNFVFPAEIERPMPPKNANGHEVTAAELDNMPDEAEDEDEAGDEATKSLSAEYAIAIQGALDQLKREQDKYLSKSALKMYSPKFLQILENLADPANIGLHLIYSAFRNLEGIALLKLVLEANGFAEFKLKKTGDMWDIVDTLGGNNLPKFVLYTGTETAEEKEMIRNIYNSNWDLIPSNLSNKLSKIHENNFYGEIIKTLMITSSGAEGINLENTRFVHIVEPYWNMVRVDQVVGRARRICSHRRLPENMRTIKVFLYMCEFTDKQKTSGDAIKIMVHDTSRLVSNVGQAKTGKYAVTTDQALYEISVLKNNLTKQILNSIKETSIDCSVYDNTKEGIACYNYGFAKTNEFSSFPSYLEDENVREGTDVKVVQAGVVKVMVGEVPYVHNTVTNELYDYVLYKQDPQRIVVKGKLGKNKKGDNLII
jgi:hypothetical protein